MKRIGWIKKIKWISSGGGDNPPPPVSNQDFILSAARLFDMPGLNGYVRDQAGSVSRQPFPLSSSVIVIISDENGLGLITCRFSGDAQSLLSGKSLSVDGVIYPQYDEPNYDEGDNVTDVAFTITEGIQVFEVGQQYTIKFI